MVKSFLILVRNGDIKTFSMFPHCHNCFEIVYYYDVYGKSNYEKLSGVQYDALNKDFMTADMKNDSVYNFRPNSYIIYPPDTLHNEIHETSDYSNNTHLVAIGFEAGDGFPQINEVLFGTDPDLKLFELTEKIRKEYESKSNYYSEMINAYLTEILTVIMRKRNVRQSIPDINYVKNYLDEYYVNDIDLNSLAADTGYTPEHFRLIFKKQFGMPPKAYIINKRMEFAKKLLVTTDLPLSTISERCGYWNYKHFGTYFIKIVGETPHSYRNNHKNEGV